MNRTVLTATAFTLLATPGPVLAHSGAHINPATFAEPLGGWLAVLGLLAAGMLLRETRRDEMIATGTGLALGVLRLVPVAAPILWAGGLAGAALALGSRNPSRSYRCAPIGLLSLAQGAGLASTVSLGVAEAALFVIGTGGVITLGLLFAALREQSDIVGPNSSAHPTTREPVTD